MTNDTTPIVTTYTRITGLTLSNTQTLKITGTAAGASDITASLGRVRYITA